MFRSTSFALLAICLVLLSLTGCTTYEVKRADGTELHIVSTRSFPNGIDVAYTSPQGASLTIKTGSVTQPDGSALAIGVLGQVLDRYLPPKPIAPAAAVTVPPLMLRPPETLAGGQ